MHDLCDKEGEKEGTAVIGKCEVIGKCSIEKLGLKLINEKNEDSGYKEGMFRSGEWDELGIGVRTCSVTIIYMGKSWEMKLWP